MLTDFSKCGPKSSDSDFVPSYVTGIQRIRWELGTWVTRRSERYQKRERERDRTISQRVERTQEEDGGRWKRREKTDKVRKEEREKEIEIEG